VVWFIQTRFWIGHWIYEYLEQRLYLSIAVYSIELSPVLKYCLYRAITISELQSIVHYNTHLYLPVCRHTSVLWYLHTTVDVLLPVFPNYPRATATATHSALSILSLTVLSGTLSNNWLLLKFKLYCDRRSVGQFVLVSRPFWSGWPNVTFIWVKITFLFVHAGRPLWREDGSVICSAMMQVQFQVILRPTVCRPVRFDAGPPMEPITRF
jgi:hypothetical protein